MFARWLRSLCSSLSRCQVSRAHRKLKRRSSFVLRGEQLELRRVFAADFNGDGYDDMVVGLAGYDFGANVDAGAIQVMYGALGGLPGGGVTYDEAAFGGAVTTNHNFGFAITTGDFDGNGLDDLAVSVIGLDSGAVDAGGVYVVYSTIMAAGLDFSTVELWTQDTAGVLDFCEPGDNFGTTLTVGDFNADGYDDLVIGVPYEDVAAAVDAGAVNIINGSIVGLGAGYGFWTQDSLGIVDVSETGDLFGMALATGDFSRDGRDDLAIGIPQEDVLLVADAGAIQVIYSVGAGLGAAGNQFLHQNSPGVPDTCEPNDYFGSSLAAGDFDLNLADDLVVGVPNEDLAGVLIDAGSVHVMYGGALGVGLMQQYWTQDSAGILDVAEVDDHFGGAVAAGDFDGDGVADLAIGAWREDLGAANAGAVNVIYGAALFGLVAAGNQFWAQGLGGILDAQEVDDFFGAELSVADYDGDGCADLTIGTPGEDVLLTPNAGAVDVIYGSGVGLVAGGNDFWDSLLGALALQADSGLGKSLRR